LLGTPDPHKIERAIAAYRRRFEQVGIFENVLYPGIAEMLTQLATVGYLMCVVTAKLRTYRTWVGSSRAFGGTALRRM
jgi:phosphoglycolate phosphatase